MHRGLARPGRKHKTADPDKITQVKELLEDIIVQRLVLAGADLVPRQVDLDPSGRVLQLGKRSLTHDPLHHEPACQGDILQFLPFPAECILDPLRVMGHFEPVSWIRIKTCFNDLPEIVPPDEFLFTKLHITIKFGTSKVRDSIDLEPVSPAMIMKHFGPPVFYSL